MQAFSDSIALLFFEHFCYQPILLIIFLYLYFSAACVFIGIICWVSDVSRSLSWAFYLCVIAGILAVIGGILLIPERRIIVIGRTTTGGGGTAIRTVTTTRTVTVR